MYAYGCVVCVGVVGMCMCGGVRCVCAHVFECVHVHVCEVCVHGYVCVHVCLHGCVVRYVCGMCAVYVYTCVCMCV